MPTFGFACLQKARSLIEASAPAPALILITSATSDDGRTMAASTLAGCLAAAKYRVALLISEAHLVTASAQEAPFTHYRLADEIEREISASDAIAALAGRMRNAYDFTIVDGPVLEENRTSMALASIADVVFLAMRLRRFGCPEDTSLMHALQRSKARVLGVIGSTQGSTPERNGHRAGRRNEPVKSPVTRSHSLRDTTPSTAAAPNA